MISGARLKLRIKTKIYLLHSYNIFFNLSYRIYKYIFEKGWFAISDRNSINSITLFR